MELGLARSHRTTSLPVIHTVDRSAMASQYLELRSEPFTIPKLSNFPVFNIRESKSRLGLRIRTPMHLCLPPLLVLKVSLPERSYLMADTAATLCI